MKNITSKKYSLFFIAIMAILFFSVLVANGGSAYANNEDLASAHDWRPSCQIDKELNELYSSIDDISNNIAAINQQIIDFEHNNNDYDSVISEAQHNFDYYSEIFESMRPQIEETTKTSYATQFAKKLIDEVVGSEWVTDWLFHFNVVTMVVSTEDQEILNLVDDYCNAKIALEKSINDKNDAVNNYESNKTKACSLNQQLGLNAEKIKYLEDLMSFVLPIEKVNGAAGESRIEGNGYFCHPCPESVIVSNVGVQRIGYTHQGVDFANNFGTPIYAAADGVVVSTGYHPTAGNFVKILHDNGLVTIYMHCSTVFVPENVRVHKGDNISLVGSTGDSTGPHLHFQTETVEGQILNGLDYMKES